MTARDDVLENGLTDWVPLERIHWYVGDENKGQPTAVVQSKVVDLITELVEDGSFVVGDTTGAGGTFVPWTTPVAEAMERVRDLYVKNFADSSTWGWAVWLALTDKGRPAAEAINAKWLKSQANS